MTAPGGRFNEVGWADVPGSGQDFGVSTMGSVDSLGDRVGFIVSSPPKPTKPVGNAL